MTPSLLATPVRRADDSGNGLVVTLLSQPSVSSAGGITIDATVENTVSHKDTPLLHPKLIMFSQGSQPVRLLKYGSVLDNEHPTRSFKVSHTDGRDVPFQGVRLQLSNNLSEDAYITIPAGGRLTKSHTDLDRIYDFSSTGPGTYQFELVQSFYSDSHSTGGSVSAKVEKFKTTSSVLVEVTGNTAKRELAEREVAKRDKVTCSNTAASAQIVAS
jgi:deuterolysin